MRNNAPRLIISRATCVVIQGCHLPPRERGYRTNKVMPSASGHRYRRFPPPKKRKFSLESILSEVFSLSLAFLPCLVLGSYGRSTTTTPEEGEGWRDSFQSISATLSLQTI